MSSNSIDNAVMDIIASKPGRANAGSQARSAAGQDASRAFSGMLDDELGLPEPVVAPKDSPPQYTYTVSAAPAVAAVEQARGQGAAMGGDAVESTAAISSGAFTSQVGQSRPSQPVVGSTGEGNPPLTFSVDGGIDAGATLDGELIASPAADAVGEAAADLGVDGEVVAPKASGPIASSVQAEAGGVAKVMALPTADPDALSSGNVMSEVLPVAADAEVAVDASAAEVASSLKAAVKVPDTQIPAQNAPAQDGVAEAVPAPANIDAAKDAAVQAEAEAEAAAAKPVAAAESEETARNSANTQQVTGAAAVAATLTTKDGLRITEQPVAPGAGTVPAAIMRTPSVAEAEALANGPQGNPQQSLSDGAAREGAKPAGDALAEAARGDADAGAKRPAVAEARLGEPTSKHIMLPESLAATALTPAAAAPTQAVTPHLAAGTMPAVTLAVASEMVAQHRSGVSRFEIRLDPPELGRIDVRLDVDKAGNVRSHLIVERPETLDMLRADQRNLERTLEQAGFKSDPNGVSMSLRDNGAGSGQNGRSFEAAMTQGVDPVVTEEPKPLLADIASGASSSSSNLDIRV